MHSTSSLFWMCAAARARWRETGQGDTQHLFNRALIYSSFNAIYVSCCTFLLQLNKRVLTRKIFIINYLDLMGQMYTNLQNVTCYTLLLMKVTLLKRSNTWHCLNLYGWVCKCVMTLLVLIPLLMTRDNMLHLAKLHFNLVRSTLLNVSPHHPWLMTL